MGKKRHSKDRLFITSTEHKFEWGGKKDPTKAPVSKLPFYCCSLSLLPFEDPVCTKDGIIFDIVNVIPFVRKYKRNPVTWEPLKANELIKLNFHKNAAGEYHDPVTFKVFTEFSTILAVATTGNVYDKETIEELNRKPKFWKDLLTNAAFTSKDLIVLQDPTNLNTKTVDSFHYIKENIDISDLKKKSNEESNTVNLNETGKRVLKELEEQYAKEEQDEETKEPALRKKLKTEQAPVDENSIVPADYVRRKLGSKEAVHSSLSSGKAAASFTSTSFDLTSENKRRALTADEIRKDYYDYVKSKQLKGYVQMMTNHGGLNLMIHCDLVPKTGENFIELCEKKYFNDVKFHRLVRNFCLQGGDPTGTGRGGESIFGGPFEDEFHPKLTHSGPGILSMANSGPKTNKSQFFFTLRATPHLNNKHSVFGEVVGGMPLIETFNGFSADANARPTKDITIVDTVVLTNPYRDMIKILVDKQTKKKEEEKKIEEENKRKDERWITSGEITKPIFNPKPQQTTQKLTDSQSHVNSLVNDLMAPEEAGKTKRKGFDFSGW